LNTTGHLRDKQVILKLVGVEKTLPGTITNVEEIGVWFVGSEISKALSPAGYGAQNQHAFFVPFSALAWVMATVE
jgi:hypothetical protein